MKKIFTSFLLICSLSLFSKTVNSVKTTGSVISSSFNKPNAQQADVWHLNETMVGHNVTLYLCNGDVIFLEQYTIHIDIVGVTNQNRLMVQGKYELTSTGVSMVTGEVYTIDDRFKVNNHYPVIHGATVMNNQSRGSVVGNMGSRDQYVLKSHMIVNAQGQLVSDYYEVKSNCQ